MAVRVAVHHPLPDSTWDNWLDSTPDLSSVNSTQDHGVDVEHQPTDLVVGCGSGGCDVELDHQGAVVADRRGDHPGRAGLDHPGRVVAQDMIQLLGRGRIGPAAAPP